MKYTWKFEKKYIIFSILNQILQGLLAIFALIMPKLIIDALTKGAVLEECIVLIMAFAGGNFVGNYLVTFFSGQCFALKGTVFTQFQAYMAEKLSKCDYECLENPDFLNDKEKAKKFLYANGQGFGVVMDNAFSIIGKIFVFLGIISILATLNLGLVIFFIILILVSAKYEAAKRQVYFKMDMKKAPIERRTSYLINLIEDFQFGKDIRIFGLSDWIVGKVKKHLQESNHFYAGQVKETTKAQYFSTMTNMFLEGTAYVVFAIEVLYKGISIGSFSMYVSAMLKFSSAMRDVMKSIVDIRQFSGYYEALEKYMNVPSTVYEENKLVKDTNFKCIKFENVSFKYPGQERYSLQNVNLTINAGEKIAVVGENGAGKTTFIKLICRMYHPTEGKITVDGIDIRDIDYESYMKMIGPVFQDYKLFSFTIKDNICFEKEEADDKIYKLLEESGLEKKLSQLSKGVNTSIYKNFDIEGFEPSGGESQKIAIARAIYKNAPLLILDEPTSALDPKAEYELYQRFYKMAHGKTAIFISHRMSSCKFCDSILLFDNGKILEQGTHKELMEQNGKYCQMFELQAQYYIE